MNLDHHDKDSSSERMILPLWRSLYSLNLMLPKEDRKAMLLRIYNDDSPLLDHSKERFENKSRASPNEAFGDAEIEVDAAAEQDEKKQVGQVRNDMTLCDDDDDEDLEQGVVAIDPLAGEVMVTGAEGGGTNAVVGNYGTSMGADNLLE